MYSLRRAREIRFDLGEIRSAIAAAAGFTARGNYILPRAKFPFV